MSTRLETRNPPVSTTMFQVMSQSSRSIVVFAENAATVPPRGPGPIIGELGG